MHILRGSEWYRSHICRDGGISPGTIHLVSVEVLRTLIQLLPCSLHTVMTSKFLRGPKYYPEWVSNSLVHSLRALSTLRRSGLRTASTAAKPCQGDSLEFYLITGNLQHSFRNSDACYHDPEMCEHAGPKVTTSHGGNTTTRMIWRFTVADDLKECS
ncbi:hypothetical protein Tco_0006217 [Tanacetum coccineum]